MSNVALLHDLHSAYKAGGSQSLYCVSQPHAWETKFLDFSLNIVWAIFGFRLDQRRLWL